MLKPSSGAPIAEPRTLTRDPPTTLEETWERSSSFSIVREQSIEDDDEDENER